VTAWSIGLAVIAGLSPYVQGGQALTLDVLSPLAGTYVNGAIRLEAAVTPADAAGQVVQVTFSADGEVVCTVRRPPFTCPWDAGRTVRAHQIRVVAELAGGERLVRTVRTRAVELSESTGVTAVQVPVTVTDRQGRFVPRLSAADFVVLEEGTPQAITGFASEQSGVALAFALDTSGSMGMTIKAVKQQAKSFLQMLPASWPATIFSFNESVFTVATPAVTAAERDRAIDELKTWGGTALFDMVVESLRSVDGADGRKAVVIFTDGADEHSLVGAADVKQAIELSNAVLYFVTAGNAARGSSHDLLVEFAELSGGRVIRGRDDDAMASAFRSVLDELRNQYLLTYVPVKLAPAGTWRSLAVKVGCSGCRVRARGAYRVAEGPR